MIIDSLLIFSNLQDLTQLVAGTPAPSTNQIDLSQNRDIGVGTHLELYAQCPTIPVSATSTAAITVALQGSVDDATWTTIESSGPVLVSSMSANLQPFLFRTRLPMSNFLYRYIQLTYTTTAALTAGTVFSGINLDVPRHPYYPRNYAA